VNEVNIGGDYEIGRCVRRCVCHVFETPKAISITVPDRRMVTM